ncbi:MAG: peptidylprolyl isomerase [Polyangiales bacterium]
MGVVALLSLGCGRLAGCGAEASGTAPGTPSADRDWDAWVRAVDARRVPPDAAAGLRAEGSGDRRRAVVLLGRLESPDLAPTLARMLGDEDAGVRRAASAALGAQPGTALAETALLGRLTGETDPAVRGALLTDLGRVTVDAGAPALLLGLEAGEPRVQGGACRGLGHRAVRKLGAPTEAISAMASIVGAGRAGGPGGDCAFALARLAALGPLDASIRGAVEPALVGGLGSEDVTVRRFAARALGSWAGPSAAARLAVASEDPEWTVAVEAVRALGVISGRTRDAGSLAAVLGRLATRALAEDAEYGGAQDHVVLAALEAARPVARETSIRAVAERIRAGLAEARIPEALRRDAARLECAAAELLDLGAGPAAPSTQVVGTSTRGIATSGVLGGAVSRCGRGVVSPLDRALLELRVVGARRGDPRVDDARRLADVERVAAAFRREPRVLEAALEILGTLGVPGAPRAVAALENGESEGQTAALCDAARALRAGAARVVPAAGLPAAVDRGLAAMLDRDAPEAIQACLRAAAALGTGSERIRRAAHHWNVAVRTEAKAAAELLGLVLPAGAPSDPVPNPLPAGAKLPRGDVRVRLRTDRGEVVLALDADLAPVSVARLLALVDAHFYDGIQFHRVVPGFVVQAGDPGADGYGGPGWSMRSEESDVPFERGTVGMALAGRDTGGSQFFVTHGREPHLDGAYPVVGRVVSGMDVVDRLEQGDRILQATR